ncbi:MAG TPA: hypothetical protein PKH24_19335 [Sedimentisphaerales bacterium]|nr:hypothetical protein [Sedimentisphaerales bacterium]HNU31259.1 hypothetical protein [Sedimentisphaerales bacterium]
MDQMIGRRRFLTLAGAAVVSGKCRATTAVRESSPVDGAPWRMRLATSSIHFMELPIENHGSALLDSTDSFKAFVDVNSSPRLGIALAPYHLQAAEVSVPDVIRICGRQLLFFYAWQNQPDSSQLPGVGPTDMTPWIRALAEVKYRGYVNPFMHGHPGTNVMTANLATAKGYLKSCYAKACETAGA